MIKSRIAGGWLLIDGILIALFGLVHLAFAPTVYNTISAELELAMSLALIYMFAVAGLSLLLAGWIVMVSAFKFVKRDKLARTMIITVGVYILTGGLGAVMVMSGNIFSYILLGLGVLEILPVIFFWKPAWEVEREALNDEDVGATA